ncbi:MFS transporter [Shewanella waksmanii]|uniref:MFS transporter n=1 Tax=Shewanella waksmanii TaxID=213783 RepID=UPI00048D040F|nr:MFS transporter [Shewanella waksmanii]
MKTNKFIVALVLVTFFVVSFITNILGPIFPSLVADFDISLALAGFLPFSFFAAYGVMSIPAGILVDKHGEKPVIIGAFLLAFSGSLLFALLPTFTMAMLSLFCIGMGMAMLQVAINPLLRVVGGEENFAFYSVSGQLLFGIAGTLSPIVFSYFVTELNAPAANGFTSVAQSVIPSNMPWLSMYWLFAAMSIFMVVLVSKVRLPKVSRNDEEATGTFAVYKQLLSNKQVMLFFIAIAAYVGSEQGIANFMSLYLQQAHGIDPLTQGAGVVSQFWLMLTIGCVLGLGLVKILDSRIVLILFSTAAIAALCFALFGSVEVALIAFPLTGFFLSVMWSIIFSLALNSVKAHHGSVAGILCTGIIGGGLASPLVGLIIDLTGNLKSGMVVVFVLLAYICSIGFWAKPLVANKTIKLFNKRATPVS